MYVIEEKLLVDIFDYLKKQPYQEVLFFCQALQHLQKYEEFKKKEENIKKNEIGEKK